MHLVVVLRIENWIGSSSMIDKDSRHATVETTTCTHTFWTTSLHFNLLLIWGPEQTFKIQEQQIYSFLSATSETTVAVNFHRSSYRFPTIEVYYT